MLHIRIDDFPSTKVEEFYRHNLESFKRFDEVMRKHCPRGYLLGVIPRHVTHEQLKWLWEQEHIRIALHGVHHDERYLNEFLPHLTEQDIEDRIYRALCTLYPRYEDGRSKSVKDMLVDYIPPHNVIDHRTVRALNQLAFRNIYGGPGTDPAVAEHARSLRMNFHVSKFPEEYGRSDELIQRGSVEHILKESKERDVWLTLHWTWEHNIGLEHLDGYLGMLGDVLL